MNTIKTCATCGKSLGIYQTNMFRAPEICMDCQTKARIELILSCLPDEKDWEWERLSEWEQKFLPSVRQQFARKGILSEAQYQPLESIWKKMNR